MQKLIFDTIVNSLFPLQLWISNKFVFVQPLENFLQLIAGKEMCSCRRSQVLHIMDTAAEKG